VRAALLVLMVAPLASNIVFAQSTKPVVVVQIAGTSLYLNAGTDAGVVAGDTVAVRRSPTAAPVGAAAVIAATSTRSVVTFVGTPFPVTRGDTLYITPGSNAAPHAASASTRSAAPAAARLRTRMDGSLGLEMWTSHTLTIGLGAAPIRRTRDVGIPAMRLRTRISRGDGSALSLNLRAQQRSGPQGMFDKASSVRIYEARYDRRVGVTKLSFGRFFSDFDHASGFWDGASVRIGDGRGVFGGVAAGFEPVRDNEEFSADVGKYAAFVGTRAGTGETRIASDLSFHQTLPRDTTPKRTIIDWSTRLNAGRFGMAHEIEASPSAGSGSWGVSRFNVRVSTPLGRAAELYGSAFSDRPPPLDSTWAVPQERRERVSAGVSYQVGNWLTADVNSSINAPRDSSPGHATGAMFTFPNLIRTATVSFNGSHYSTGANSGITVISSIEYRIRGSRMRAGYQFFRAQGAGYSINTHGSDLRLSQSVASRVDWVAQLNTRFGDNLRSTTAYSTFEVRF